LDKVGGRVGSQFHSLSEWDGSHLPACQKNVREASLDAYFGQQ